MSKTRRLIKHFEVDSSSGDTGSSSSVVDPEEFPVGILKEFSEEFATDNKFSTDMTLQSDSSLCSLSMLDEVIASASRNTELQACSQNIPVLRTIERQQLLSCVQETSCLVNQPSGTQHGIFHAQPFPVNNSGCSHLGQTDFKTVKNKSGLDFDDILVKFATKTEVHESNSANSPGSVKSAQDQDRSSRSGREVLVSNGHGSVISASGGGVETNGPAVLFTSDMTQRHKLVPTQTRETTDNCLSNDLIMELKIATRGPVLKNTAKFGNPSSRNCVTPLMSFSDGQNSAVDKKMPSDNKDGKLELTGEWDPKNFIDKVQNRDDLPAWKVQLQARHIAEKAMKEELERRKIAENEARFKNVPAWKRALIEKKGAAVKAASGQKQLEPQMTPHKHTHNINVEPKSGNPTDLAPWQLALKGN